MSEKYFTRRQFLQFGGGGLSFFFLFRLISNFSKKVKISFQSSVLPNSFKKTLPKKWKKQKINFAEFKSEGNNSKLLDSDFTLINDGWIDIINFDNYQNINYSSLLDKLDERSENFLNTFDEDKRNKLFPIGVVPYAVLIKNNKDLINSANESWDFLLSKNLMGKIIFPQSPRIVMSIAKVIDAKNSLGKLKSQAMMFEDKNSLNWFINTEDSLAIVPYSLCYKYPKIDSRISIVFPKQGVPLMWNFMLTRSTNKKDTLIDWINSLEKKRTIDKLSNEGWYLPFNSDYSQSKYKSEKFPISGPSEECWENSWPFPVLTNAQKINLKNFWNESLTP